MSKTGERATTRRQAISTLGTFAGALIVHPRCLHAESGPRSEIAFAVVTDTHLGYKDQPKAEEVWKKTAAEVAKAPGAFVLHLGDVVDGGREAEYPKYLAVRETIGKPVHEIPGNHDPQDLFQRYLRKDVDTALEHEWLRILMINNSRRESHEGFILPEQIAWMGGQCDQAAAKNQLLLFAMHVPVHFNQHPDRGWYVKPESGQKEFYALLDKHASRTLALFHGHFHNGLRGWDDRAPVQEICFPSALYNLDRKLEEKKAPGYNPLEFRPGFTRVKFRTGAMELEYQPVGAPDFLKRQYDRAPA